MAGAERACLSDERGQSVLEFLFLAPVIVGIAMIMMRVNSAIQISIVNQQYARAQATWLAFNYGIYPEIKLRVPDFYQKNYNEMILGVSFNAPSAGATDGGGAGSSTQYQPQPMVQDIRRTPSAAKAPDDGTASIEGTTNPQRTQVRIRTTVAMCTGPYFTANGMALPYDKTGNVGAYALLNDPSEFSGQLCSSPYLTSLTGGP